MAEPLPALAQRILSDGVIDADEVKKLRDRIYADGVIDRDEANFLFDLNDKSQTDENHSSWQALFVEAISDHLLKDESSPGTIDDDEALWLLERIKADGTIDANEQALINHLKTAAQSVSPQFNEGFNI